MSRIRDVHEFVKYIHDVGLPELLEKERQAKKNRNKGKNSKRKIARKINPHQEAL